MAVAPQIPTGTAANPVNPNDLVDHIVVDDHGDAFASYQLGATQIYSGALSVLALSSNQEQWNVVGAPPLPSGGNQCFGLALDDVGTLFLAVDNGVFVSHDGGANWLSASNGLPLLPHCSDLAFGLDWSGPVMYLATMGRGVWKARLPKGGKSQ
jgi:hypothetical protein